SGESSPGGPRSRCSAPRRPPPTRSDSAAPMPARSSVAEPNARAPPARPLGARPPHAAPSLPPIVVDDDEVRRAGACACELTTQVTRRHLPPHRRVARGRLRRGDNQRATSPRDREPVRREAAGDDEAWLVFDQYRA